MKPQIRNLLYLFSLTPVLMVVFGNLSGGFLVHTNIIYSLLVLGISEWVSKPLPSNAHSPKEDTLPLFVLWLHIPAQLLSLFTFFYGIHQGIIEHIWLVGAAFSMGIYSGSGAIVVAHELIHRKEPVHQWMGKFLLFTAGNFYFYVEHLRVHHKWVGTNRDSATALKGQSLYHFFVSSSLGQIKGAWKLENERLRKAAKHPFSLNHYVIRQVFLHILLDTAIVWLIGWLALGAFVLHCVVANFLLEYVNYIEHYGLSRNDNERVTEKHSWQSDLFVSRFVLIDLSRHADHHYYASKPYHTLDSYAQSPVLPSGYAGLFFIAAIPPLWFKVMDSRLPETH